MKRLSALGFAFLLVTPALAQSVGEKSGVNSMVGVTPSTQDFVTEAAQSDMFELQSSDLALTNSTAPTKVFAQQMITDHGKTTAELKSAVQDGSVQATLPTTMSSSQQGMLDKLRGLHGTEFTSQYNSDQVSVHKDAVSLFQRYSKGTDNATLKNWAGSTLPTLQQHLDMAENLNK
jgi:putative membrane protein